MRSSRVGGSLSAYELALASEDGVQHDAGGEHDRDQEGSKQGKPFVSKFQVGRPEVAIRAQGLKSLRTWKLARLCPRSCAWYVTFL